jgi:hypothetical protein
MKSQRKQQNIKIPIIIFPSIASADSLLGYWPDSRARVGQNGFQERHKNEKRQDSTNSSQGNGRLIGEATIED